MAAKKMATNLHTDTPTNGRSLKDSATLLVPHFVAHLTETLHVPHFCVTHTMVLFNYLCIHEG